MESIDKLVDEGFLSKEIATKWKGEWVDSCDALYSRMAACLFSTNRDKMIELMEDKRD